MARLHILNWVGLSGWVWVTAFVSSLTAQSMDDLLGILGRDAEHSLSEEDQLVWEDVILDGNGISTGNLQRLSTLSILGDEDVKALRNASVTGNPESVWTDSDISPELKGLLTALVGFRKSSENRFQIQQYMSGSEDIRYRWRGSLQTGNQTWGILLERDPEERDLIDHSAIYLAGKRGPVSWVIGDHQLHAGFGLTAWRTMPVRKGYDGITSIQKMGAGLKPYRSSHEFWGIRGAALTYETVPFTMTVSAGRNFWDGSVDSAGAIKVNTTGLHPASNPDPNRITENVLTGMLEHTNPIGVFGIVSSASSWLGSNESVIRKSGSIFFSTHLGQSHFFGELGLGYNDSKGMIFGYGLRSGRFGYVAHSRYYFGAYEAFRSNPVSEWTTAARDEQGFFQVFKWSAGDQVWCVYGDIYSQTSGDHLIQSPVLGQEAGIRWVLTRESYRLRCQLAKDSRTLEDAQYFINDQPEDYRRKQTVKIVYDKTPLTNWRWRLQGIGTRAKQGSKSVFGTGFDFRFWWSVANVTLVFDWIVCVVEDYEARIYFWDLNLPGELRSAMFSGTSHASGVKVDLRGRNGYRIGFRLRAKWDDLSFTGTRSSSGALTVSASF